MCFALAWFFNLLYNSIVLLSWKHRLKISILGMEKTCRKIMYLFFKVLQLTMWFIKVLLLKLLWNLNNIKLTFCDYTMVYWVRRLWASAFRALMWKLNNRLYDFRWCQWVHLFLIILYDNSVSEVCVCVHAHARVCMHFFLCVYGGVAWGGKCACACILTCVRLCVCAHAWTVGRNNGLYLNDMLSWYPQLKKGCYFFVVGATSSNSWS